MYSGFLHSVCGMEAATGLSDWVFHLQYRIVGIFILVNGITFIHVNNCNLAIISVITKNSFFLMICRLKIKIQMCFSSVMPEFLAIMARNHSRFMHFVTDFQSD